MKIRECINGVVVEREFTQEEILIFEQEEKESTIAMLKEKLQAEDYKIIKCFEAQVKGEAMPYDIETLIAKRDEYRAEINELENG